MSEHDSIRNEGQDASAGGGLQRQIRQPVMAGRFYPADPEDCRGLVARYLSDGQPADLQSADLRSAGAGSPDIGAIVPHAGWICSGAVAGRSIAALMSRRRTPPAVVVIFAAIHSPGDATRAIFCSAGAWRTPLGAQRVKEQIFKFVGLPH